MARKSNAGCIEDLFAEHVPAYHVIDVDVCHERQSLSNFVEDGFAGPVISEYGFSTVKSVCTMGQLDSTMGLEFPVLDVVVHESDVRRDSAGDKSKWCQGRLVRDPVSGVIVSKAVFTKRQML